MLDGSSPSSSIESEACHASVFGHWRKLEEITGNDKLDATKWSTVISNGPGNLLQFVEQITVYHGNLIDDEHLRAHPPLLRLGIPPDLLHQILRRLLAQSDA